VIGASGGVGSFFVQLAAAAGAAVIAPGLPEDRDYLRDLGAREVPDRKDRRAYTDGVEAVLDLVTRTPDTWPLKPGGRLASPLGAAGEGPGRSNPFASPTPANLDRLAQLLDGGSLRVPIQRTFPLLRATAAPRQLADRHTQGKLAIAVAQSGKRRGFPRRP
jgi:NADPH:quinone reductase